MDYRGVLLPLITHYGSNMNYINYMNFFFLNSQIPQFYMSHMNYKGVLFPLTPHFRDYMNYMSYMDYRTFLKFSNYTNYMNYKGVLLPLIINFRNYMNYMNYDTNIFF